MRSEPNIIRRDIFALILPIIAENILQVSAGIVSAAMVGRLAAADVAGQGICLRITDTLWCLYKGLGIGVLILTAKAAGAENHTECRRILKSGYAAALIPALAAGILLTAFPNTFFGFFTRDSDVLSRAKDFMGPLVFGFPAVVSMQMITAAFQGRGDARTPMIIAAIVNGSNLLLGYLLIFGPGPFPELGVRGAALALTLSQILGTGLGLILFSKLLKQKNLSSGQKGRNPENETPGRLAGVGRVISIGLPASLEGIFWQLSAVVLSRIILSYGENAFAAYQLGIQAETITEMPAIGFSAAAASLVSRAIGRNNLIQEKAYVRELTRTALIISGITSMLLLSLPGRFMALMTDKSTLQSIGTAYVFTMGFIQIPQNLSRIYNGAIRAAGRSRVPMYIAATGIWGFRIPLCYAAAGLLKWDIGTIWIIIAADQLIRFLLSFGFYGIHSHRRKTVTEQIWRKPIKHPSPPTSPFSSWRPPGDRDS